jgi:hypothetical protein
VGWRGGSEFPTVYRFGSNCTFRPDYIYKAGRNRGESSCMSSLSSRIKERGTQNGLPALYIYPRMVYLLTDVKNIDFKGESNEVI